MSIAREASSHRSHDSHSVSVIPCCLLMVMVLVRIAMRISMPNARSRAIGHTNDSQCKCYIMLRCLITYVYGLDEECYEDKYFYC